MKTVTVEEVLKEIQAKKKMDKKGVEKWVYNRFNKKNYNSLLKAMLNDPSLKMVTTKLKEQGATSEEEIMVTKEFREFLKKILIKAGVDANDANAVMSEEFVIDNVDGLYEFFATSMWLYMNAGNKFDMIPTNDFKGSLYIETVPETKKTYDARDPKKPKGENYIGTFETTKKSHKKLNVKSSCPSWLVSRKQVK